MPKSQKEETLSALTTRIFSSMLEDIVMDVALQSHHETARSRSICTVCQTRCSSVHTPSTSQVVLQPSRQSTPSEARGGTGTSTPTSVKADGNLYLECVNCSRQIASNRYAPHLSSCMGLATTRRGAARGSAVKSKPSSELGGRSTSPEGAVSDDDSNLKGKGKSKRTDEAEFNLKKRKRVESPQLTPNKKQKKKSVSASPAARIKANGHSPSKVPSKLRDSSTSFVERSASPSSGYSSPADSPAVSSPYSMQSPSLNGSPAKSVTSKAPLVPPIRTPPRAVLDDYDDGGDETGSSTDTDSS
ncbi:hypothetical protein C8J57DRAFT_24023 [Mycena rebaudengoi]|nr:hypothetical protein C8J57DRAFT_24023 [Mycena rebaudengoi]